MEIQVKIEDLFIIIHEKMGNVLCNRNAVLWDVAMGAGPTVAAGGLTVRSARGSVDEHSGRPCLATPGSQVRERALRCDGKCDRITQLHA